jgi:cold shock CspA family protein
MAAVMCSSITARSAARGHTSLAEGARVEYEIEQGPKGPQARDVHTVAPA